jgi:hypothetical protein
VHEVAPVSAKPHRGHDRAKMFAQLGIADVVRQFGITRFSSSSTPGARRL